MRVFLGLLLSISSFAAGPYYVSASGADTNNGTAKATPWLHAPGMAGCSNTCAGKTPAAGEFYYFKGGETWHYNTGSPTAFPWVINFTGSAGNQIYFGVDQTWFTGGSWSRPIFTQDNPLSTVLTTCTYDDTTHYFLRMFGASYVTVDNIEFTGHCQKTSAFAGMIETNTGTHLIITHNYFHGWSAEIGSEDDHPMILGATGGSISGISNNELSYNVFDGSDSFHGTTTASNQCAAAVNPPPCSSGIAIYGDLWNVHRNIFRYLSNGAIGSIGTMHDNLFEYIWGTYDGTTHPNVVESTGVYTATPMYFYNNLLRHTYANVTFWPEFDTTAYEFNNVMYDSSTISGANCFMQSPGTMGATPTAYIWNNTLDNCLIAFQASNGATPAWNGTSHIENNHLIGYTTQNFAGAVLCVTGATCTNNDDGGQIYQSEATANGQGYVQGNDYAPTSNGNSTVGSGTNLTSNCSTASSDSALCSSTSNGVSEGAGNVATYPAIPTIARSPSLPWNTGAYQFAAAPSGGNSIMGGLATFGGSRSSSLLTPGTDVQVSYNGGSGIATGTLTTSGTNILCAFVAVYASGAAPTSITCGGVTMTAVGTAHAYTVLGGDFVQFFFAVGITPGSTVISATSTGDLLGWAMYWTHAKQTGQPDAVFAYSSAGVTDGSNEAALNGTTVADKSAIMGLFASSLVMSTSPSTNGTFVGAIQFGDGYFWRSTNTVTPAGATTLKAKTSNTPGTAFEAMGFSIAPE